MTRTGRTATGSGALPAHPASSPVTDQGLWTLVARYARCADNSLDPDMWFPLSGTADRARHEAAAAIAVCNSCLVRGECLALSLRHWDIGQHGIWGGLNAADRARLRRALAVSSRDAANGMQLLLGVSNDHVTQPSPDAAGTAGRRRNRGCPSGLQFVRLILRQQ